MPPPPPGGDGGSFNAQAADKAIAHRLALLRYEGGTTRAMLAAYDAALADVRRALTRLQARIDAGASRDELQLDRLRGLSTDLDQRVRDLRRLLESTLADRLTEAAEAEALFQRRLFDRGLGASMARVPESAVGVSLAEPIGGGIWTDRLAVDLFAAREGLQGTLARMLAQGASMDRIAAEIGTAQGIVETYRGRLVSIARTEVQRVSNTVALRTYAENTGILSGVQWLATLDSRTCLVCAPLHNRVYRYGPDGQLPADFRPPPLHPRCRCFVSPLTRGWRDLGFDVPPQQRALFGDEPATETTFDQWLRRQDEDTQTEIMGAERRRLWLSGVGLDRFTDGRRVLALGELRASLA